MKFFNWINVRYICICIYVCEGTYNGIESAMWKGENLPFVTTGMDREHIMLST